MMGRLMFILMAAWFGASALAATVVTPLLPGIPTFTTDWQQTGVASWYGKAFRGRLTANGETFHEGEMTAAHRTLPMDSLVRVVNLDNEREVVVRINDRGPYKKRRIIDLTRRAAELLGFLDDGVAKVRLELVPK